MGADTTLKRLKTHSAVNDETTREAVQKGLDGSSARHAEQFQASRKAEEKRMVPEHPARSELFHRKGPPLRPSNLLRVVNPFQSPSIPSRPRPPLRPSNLLRVVNAFETPSIPSRPTQTSPHQNRNHPATVHPSRLDCYDTRSDTTENAGNGGGSMKSGGMESRAAKSDERMAQCEAKLSSQSLEITRFMPPIGY